MLYGIIGVLIVGIIFIGFLFSCYSTNINRQTFEESKAWQKDHYDISWYNEDDEKTYVVNSYDGYELHMHFLASENNSGKYVIISHGHTDNHYGDLKYARIYLSLGYNVITYDLRGHGENEKTYCTFSMRESKDLFKIIEDTHKRYGDISVLGIHGESLGAATSISVLKFEPDIDFVVADCAFARISPVLKAGLKAGHTPMIFYYIASAWTKIRTGYYYKDMSPIDEISKNKIPVLFIHGADDEFVDKSNSEQMHKKNGGYSDLLIMDKAGHAASVFTDYKLYSDTVQKFLENVE